MFFQFLDQLICKPCAEALSDAPPWKFFLYKSIRIAVSSCQLLVFHFWKTWDEFIGRWSGSLSYSSHSEIFDWITWDLTPKNAVKVVRIVIQCYLTLHGYEITSHSNFSKPNLRIVLAFSLNSPWRGKWYPSDDGLPIWSEGYPQKGRNPRIFWKHSPFLQFGYCVPVPWSFFDIKRCAVCVQLSPTFCGCLECIFAMILPSSASFLFPWSIFHFVFLCLLAYWPCDFLQVPKILWSQCYKSQLDNVACQHLPQLSWNHRAENCVLQIKTIFFRFCVQKYALIDIISTRVEFMWSGSAMLT